MKVIGYIKRKLVFFLVNNVFQGTRPQFFPIKRNLLNGIGYQIGKSSKIVGPIRCTGTLEVGNNCWIGSGLTIHGNGHVIIGDSCDLGPEVTFLTGSHRIGSPERRAGEGYNSTISIASGCWIGCKSVFTNNIEIGESVVVAAGALVCKSITGNVLVGGVPAKVIRNL